MEINQQRQCQTCSVCFLTNDKLRDHLDKYRSQERLLAAKLERCRVHSSPLDEEHDTSYDAHNYDNVHADGDVYDPTPLRKNDKSTDQLCCPHEECERDSPFSKRTRLVRHFALHVQCTEVCVYCFKVFKVASQYIAHADIHKDADMTKNSYTRQICDRLREIAAEKLDECQLKGVKINPTSHQFRMVAVEIHNMTETKQKLHVALNILDAISAYSINHQLPSDHLFDIDVRKRLQNLYPKLSSPIYHLLEDSDELSEDEKITLSPYCYKIEDSADDCDDVLDRLEAHYKQMNPQNLASEGELIDTIIRGGVSKTIRSVAGILDVIGSLALWHIRELNARTLATQRGHKLISEEDNCNAATEMWQQLRAYNSDADRVKLDERVKAGIWWATFLTGRDIGMILAVHKLPSSLKLPTKLTLKLAVIVTGMPGMLDRVGKATPCVQKLLDLRLGRWSRSKEGQLLVQSVPDPGTEAGSGTPGGNTNLIGALLNAAEHIEAASQGQQVPSYGSPSIADQIDSTLPGSPVSEGSHPFATGQPEIWSNGAESRGLDSQGDVLESRRKRRRVDPLLQPIYKEVGAYEETGLAGGMRTKLIEVDKLKGILGGCLFEGMRLSRRRHREKEEGWISFTDSVSLHFAHQKDEDFMLEVWLCSSVGKDISQAKMGSVEDLRSMLGGYLFEAMDASNWRKEEISKGISDCTRAVDVAFPNGEDGSDCKMEVMLSFIMGQRVFEDTLS